MARDLSSIYLWFDTEFTSLELDRARLLQVALVATDAELKRIVPVERDFNCYVRLHGNVRLDPWVRKNLAALIARCRTPDAVPARELDARLDAYLEDVLGPSPRDIRKRPILAGNSLHGDWYLARKFMPSLIERSHYRIMDVSSWKVFWKNAVGDFPFDKEDNAAIKEYFPGEFTSPEQAHDAHFDVLASIAELNFYRRHSRITWRKKK